MSKKLALILSLAMAALPGVAQALGLGEIKLNSALNDRFSADIQIVGATSDELDSLDVKLASLAQFSQAGIDHPEVLNQLQFVVVRNADGTAYVHITSGQGVREPFLDFLIDANWNNGELIREYTVLLNPQSFQTASAPNTEAAPAAASAPVTAAVAAAPVPVPAVAAPTPVSAPAPAPAETQPAAQAEQPAPAVAAAEQPTAPAPQPTASPPASGPAPTVETAPAQRALGANYGPIHRGETLSGIAKQVRPDGATLNQMMIAIYQANPEVFMHNINRMKAGYILRMPTAGDVQAVNVADANAEVRAQLEAWRNNRTASAPAPAAGTAEAAQPALQLVAPSSAAESNAPVPGAEKQGNGEATKGEKPATPETAEQAPAPAPAAPATPPANQAPLSVNNNALAGVQQQAAQQNAQPAPGALSAPEPAKNVPLAPPAAAKPAAAPVQPQESGGGIMDAIFNIYVLGALVAVAIVVLLGVMIKKRKKSTPSAFSAGGTMRIKGADWMKQEQAGGNDKDDTAASSTTRTRSKKKIAPPAEEKPEDKTVLVNPATQVAGGDDSDKTMLMSAPAPSMQDTMAGGGAGGSKLDVSDPMAEADFHMAYGLYDQAADVLRKALRQSPDRQDIMVKLLEVYFTAGDKDNFVTEAKKLRQAMGAAPSKEWESVAIMGRQVAPDESLFSASGGSGAAAAVDIALETGGTDTVVSDLGDAFDSGHAPPAPAPAPAAPASASADNLMDFSLPDLEPVSAAAPLPAFQAAPSAPAADGGMDFNLGDLNFEPTPPKPAAKEAKPAKAAPTISTDEPTVATDFGTDSQVEFDKALNDLAAFVNTNVPAQPGGEPAAGGLSMDDAPAPAMAAGGDEPAASSISEIGTKLDLARAYIDMGDPDGAKSILAEVIGEGNAQQKQEAQELLKHVS